MTGPHSMIPVSATVPSAGRSRWYIVGVLFLASVFNFMDRQLLSILVESIKGDLGASDAAMGLLTGFAFVLFYTLASVPIARAADVHSRRNIIAAALAFWSLMTMLAGVATSFVQLAATRVGLGIGEAATGPAGQSITSDLFTSARRPAALSVLAMAVPIGFMMAYVVGGALNQTIGWRMTFVALGSPGLFLAMIVLSTMQEPRRGAAEDVEIDAERYRFLQTVSYLWSLRSLRWMVAGASLNVFAGWALMVWSASFLIRVHGMDSSEAGAWIGMALGVGGVAGTLLGGLTAQHLARHDARWLMWIPGLTNLLMLPFALLFLTLPSGVAPMMYFGIAFFGPAMIGPVMAVTQDLAKVGMRAVAAALVAMAFNLVGTGLGPLAVGTLSDLLAPSFGVGSIRYALLLPVSVAMLGAGLCFARGASHVRSDLQRVAAFERTSIHVA